MAETSKNLEVEDAPSSSLAKKKLPIIIFSSITAFLVVTTIVLAVVLTLPKTFSCHPQDKKYFVTIIDNVKINQVIPPLLCPVQTEELLEITGSQFVIYNGELPTVEIGDEVIDAISLTQCENLNIYKQNAQTCSKISFSYPIRNLTEIIFPSVTVILPKPNPPHPAASISNEPCEDIALGLLTLVPPPNVKNLFPPAICKGTSHLMNVTGTYFLNITNTYSQNFLPTLSLSNGGNFSDFKLTNCTNIPVDGLLVYTCNNIFITVNSNELAVGNYSLSVTNPSPANCISNESLQFEIYPGPSINQILPADICTQGINNMVTFSGSYFSQVSSTYPELWLNGATIPIQSLGSCVPFFLSSSISFCSQMIVNIPSGFFTTSGLVNVTLENPYPVQCEASSNSLLNVLPLISFTTINLPSVCRNSGTYNVTIYGSGFLITGGNTLGVLTVGGIVTPFTPSNCSSVFMLTNVTSVQQCTQITFQVNSNNYALGNVSLSFTNPSPYSSCSYTNYNKFYISNTPTISSFSPSDFCFSFGGTILINGSFFDLGTSVALQSTLTHESYYGNITFIDSGHLSVYFSPTQIPADTYIVVVSNGPNCFSNSGSKVLQVYPIVLVFYMNPPTIYNKISLSAVIYVSGLSSDPASVDLIGPSNQIISLTRTSVNSPSQINVIIPVNLAIGYWSVLVTSQQGCQGTLSQGLYVVDTLSISIASITPNYFFVNNTVGFTIAATSPIPVNYTGFQAVPTVYFSPTNSSGSLALAIQTVAFINSLTLTGVYVSGSLPVGVYDLVIINPDGSVGVIEGIIHIIASETPIIYSISPNAMQAQTSNTQSAVIEGNYFSTVSISLEMQCLVSGVVETATVTPVGNWTSTQITANFIWVSSTGTALPDGTVCLVVVTNPDGASFTFSAVSRVSPSGDLTGWTLSSQTMVLPRSYHTQISGEPSPGSKYLYLIGGYNGSHIHSSIEGAVVDPYGTLEQFNLYPKSALPVPLMGSGYVKANNFIYLIGGTNDGVNATTSVLRAQILNPLDTPILSPALSLTTNSTFLESGVWSYAVSAIFSPIDSINPGGESLVGPTLTLKLPNITGMVLTIGWNSINRAIGYRIYRTPLVNQPTATKGLLAEVSTTYYTDVGLSVNLSITPLPSGSLGKWRNITEAPLNLNRNKLAAVSAVNPTNSNQYFLYAFGGTNESVTFDSYEYTIVNLLPSGDQSVSPWTIGGTLPSGGRYELGAVTIVSADDTSAISNPNDVWVYVGGGIGNPKIMDAGQINLTSGALINFQSLSPTGISNTNGYAFIQSSGNFYLYGGVSGPSTTGDSAAACASGVSGCSGSFPLLSGFKNQGTALNVPRINMGFGHEVPFFVLSGGYNTTTTVTNSIETSVQ